MSHGIYQKVVVTNVTLTNEVGQILQSKIFEKVIKATELFDSKRSANYKSGGYLKKSCKVLHVYPTLGTSGHIFNSVAKNV